MRIAITADWHARGKDLPELRAQLDAMVRQCGTREVNTVAILGDVFERSQIGDNYASTGAIAAIVIQSMLGFVNHGKTITVIPGNHDCAGAGSADALHVLEGIPNLFVFRNAGSLYLRNHGQCLEHRSLWLPWMWRTDWSPIEVLTKGMPHTIDDYTEAILFAHVEVIGARMGGVQCCEVKPGKWQISREFLESLPVAHVALGHFHTRQDLTGGRGGYVGALRQLNFGEEGNPAGFEIYDTETRETTWIELDASPTYRTVEVSNPNLMPGKRTNEHLRIRYVGTQPIDPSVIAELERNEDTQLEVIVPRQERIQRAEVPAGIADDPHGLIGLWAGTQNPPVEATPLNQMYDRVHADARKE